MTDPNATVPMGGLPELPARIGAYALLTRLGEGAHGQVWRATDAHGREVALKVLRPEVADDPDLGRRFEREARIGMGIVHPHVVRVFDAGRADGRLYMATEFLTGGSAADLIERGGPLPQTRALTIVRDLLRGLQALVDHGLVHRDVKPANLLLDAAGNAKVADFGLARSTAADRTRFTVEGAIMGSPAYMAPEQIDGSGGEYGIRGDLYAAGAVLFELLTGRTPFTDTTVLGILRQHLEVAPPALRSLRRDADPAVERLIADLLRKRPGERPATPRDALLRLEPLLGITPPVVFPGTIQDGPAATAPAVFPATMPEGGAFPATMPEGSAFPATMPDGGAFPATMPEGTRGVPAGMAVRGATLSDSATLAPAAIAARELRPLGAPALSRARLTVRTPTGPGFLFVIAGSRLAAGRDGIDRPGQDLCLRLFPATTMAEASRRLSGQHLAVESSASGAVVTDLRSSGGTACDGRRLPPGQPVAVGHGSTVRLADALDLAVRVAPAADEAVAVAGIGPVSPLRAVHLVRTNNGPEHGYLLLPGTVRLGVDGLPATDGPIEVLTAGGRLWWRAAGSDEVRPLTNGSPLPLGDGIPVAAPLPADFKG